MSDRLRILHVVPYFPPDGMGGVGEVAAHLHQGLLNEGHESQVLTSGTSRHETRIHRFAKSPWQFFSRSALQGRFLKDHDLIHCHHGECLGLLLRNRISRYKLPVLCTFHSSCSSVAKANRPFVANGVRYSSGASFVKRNFVLPLRHTMDLLVLRLVARKNFISRSGAIDILGSREGEVAQVIYNGVPIEEHQAVSSDGPTRTDLLYVGSASVLKRIQLLPMILSLVRKQIPTAKLRIVGFRLEDHPELSRSFRDLELMDAVESVGKKWASELPAYYAASKVLLVPSAYEGLPMVILEAMRSGTPCVATRVCGHPEVIEDGVSGFLTAIDSPSEMASRSVELLFNTKLRETMSGRCQEIVGERFGVARQVREYVELYRDIVSLQNK